MTPQKTKSMGKAKEASPKTNHQRSKRVLEDNESDTGIVAEPTWVSVLRKVEKKKAKKASTHASEAGSSGTIAPEAEVSVPADEEEPMGRGQRTKKPRGK